MSKRLNVIALAVIALTLVGIVSNSAQSSQSTSADESAIRQIVQQLQEGWNAHDGKAFAAPFAADADYVVVNGMHIKGREAIEQGHANFLDHL